MHQADHCPLTTGHHDPGFVSQKSVDMGGGACWGVAKLEISRCARNDRLRRGSRASWDAGAAQQRYDAARGALGAVLTLSRTNAEIRNRAPYRAKMTL